MLNFGISELRLVHPQCDHLSEAARRRASGAVTVLEQAKVFATLPEAVADIHKVYATTARLRDMTQEVMSAGDAAAQAARVATMAASQVPLLSHRMYLLICFRKSTPPQNCQLIVHCF